jgi:hypothetical protein
MGVGGSGGIKELVVANYDDASFIFSPTMQNTCPKFLSLRKRVKKLCILKCIFPTRDKVNKITDAKGRTTKPGDKSCVLRGKK